MSHFQYKPSKTVYETEEEYQKDLKKLNRACKKNNISRFLKLRKRREKRNKQRSDARYYAKKCQQKLKASPSLTVQQQPQLSPTKKIQQGRTTKPPEEESDQHGSKAESSIPTASLSSSSPNTPSKKKSTTFTPTGRVRWFRKEESAASTYVDEEEYQVDFLEVKERKVVRRKRVVKRRPPSTTNSHTSNSDSNSNTTKESAAAAAAAASVLAKKPRPTPAVPKKSPKPRGVKKKKCHDCKRVTNIHRVCSYWNLKGITGSQCGKAFCLECLQSKYTVEDDARGSNNDKSGLSSSKNSAGAKSTIEDIMEHPALDSDWHCPSCLGTCQCNTCVTQRKREEERRMNRLEGERKSKRRTAAHSSYYNRFF